MDFAMQQTGTPDYMQANQYNNAPPARSEISFNLSEANTHRDEEKDFLNMGLNVVPLDANQRKIESKDSMWKPAPIVGKQMQNNNVHVQQTQQFMQHREPAPHQQQQQQLSVTQQLQQLRDREASIQDEH